MSARQKLNLASFNGVLLISGALASVFDSWLVFLLVAGLLLTGALLSGAIRLHTRR